MITLKHCHDENEVHSAIRRYCQQGHKVADIPNGEIPGWYLYGFHSAVQIEEALSTAIEMIYDPKRGVEVSELYLQYDESTDEYLLVH